MKNGTPAGWTDDIKLTNPPISGNKQNMDVDGSDIHIAREGSSGVTVEVYHMNSSDGGKTWSAPFQVSNSGILAENTDIAVENDNVPIF